MSDELLNLANDFNRYANEFELDRHFLALFLNKDKAFKDITQLKYCLSSQAKQIENTHKPSSHIQDIHKNILTVLQMLSWAERAKYNKRHGEYIGAMEVAKSVFSELHHNVLKTV